MSQRPMPKPLPKKPLPKPDPSRPPKIPLPVPPRGGPRGPADQPLPVPPRGPIPPKSGPIMPQIPNQQFPIGNNGGVLAGGGGWNWDMSDEERKNLNNPNGFWYGKDRGFIQLGSPSDIQARWNEMPQEQKDLINRQFGSIPQPIAADQAAFAFNNIQNGLSGMTGNNLNDYGQIGRNPNIPIPQVAPTGNFGDTTRALQAQGKLPWQQGQVGQNTPFLQATDADQAALGSMGGFAPIQMSTQQNELRKRMLEQKLSQQGNMSYSQPYFGPM